jgi:hypothetical protein
LAGKYDRLIDVHCDETDDPMSRHVEPLNALVTMEGIGSRSTASHTCSFGSADDTYAFRMMGELVKSGARSQALHGRQPTRYIFYGRFRGSPPLEDELRGLFCGVIGASSDAFFATSPTSPCLSFCLVSIAYEDSSASL